MTTYQANQLIQDVPRREIIHERWGNTADIMRVIMEVANKTELTEQVRAFAENYRSGTVEGQYNQLKSLWQFVRQNIRYEKDAPGTQDILHPARLWDTRKGDCKSLTVFIHFCLCALGIPSVIRFASYDKSKEIGHVYNVAILGGRAVPIDACIDTFDAQEKAKKITDKFPKVFDSSDVRSLVRQDMNAAIGQRPAPVGCAGVPRWVRGLIGGLSLYQASQSKGLPRLAFGALGAYYIYNTVKA